ncbi:MAG: helix-turn-helix domain-containing protein [Sciscionella sp.]|nr:helix-turn-helix domain-containing protein [Sciscionella sp.]
MSAFPHRGRHPRRHRVAVLVRHGVLPLELGIVHQIFGAAQSPTSRPLYEVITCAPKPGKIRTDADFTITVEHGRQALAEAQTVLVPASHEADRGEQAARLPRDVAAAIACIPRKARIASICTGSFVLAAAGLLDGCVATTHWRSAAEFRRLFPHIELDPDVLYTDNGRVLTSAGEAAGIDLCLHLIRRDHGAAVASEVARRTVVPPHRDGGQAQYIHHPVPGSVESSTGAAREWALTHLDRPLSIAVLAERAGMSTRTFTRKFRTEVGTSAALWLTQQRIQRARELLERTDLPVDRVAERAGFGTAASLRAQLHRAIGVSPSAYRATFRER